MKEIILAYQGEMTLKGLNRSKFEARLAKSIRYRPVRGTAPGLPRSSSPDGMSGKIQGDPGAVHRVH